MMNDVNWVHFAAHMVAGWAVFGLLGALWYIFSINWPRSRAVIRAHGVFDAVIMPCCHGLLFGLVCFLVAVGCFIEKRRFPHLYRARPLKPDLSFIRETLEEEDT